MESRFACVFLAVAAATLPAVFGQDTARIKPVRAGVWSLDGRRQAVELRSLSSDELVCRHNTLSTDRIHRLELQAKRFAVPDRLPTAIVVLTNDDELHLRRLTSTDETLTGTLGNERLQLPLEYVRAIALGDGRNPVSNSARRVAFFASKSDADVIGLVNGDRVVGQFVSLDQSVLEAESAAGQQTIPTDSIVFARFNSQLLSDVPDSSRRMIVELSGGSVMTANQLTTLASGEIRIQTVWDGNVVVPLRRVRAIRFVGRSKQPLTELVPASASHRPFAGRECSHEINRNINGLRPLHQSRRYFSSIGFTSGMTLTWELDRQYSTFHSRFGIDDIAPNGAAVFVVLVDGKERYRSPSTVSKIEPQFTGVVDVTGADTLTLSVEYGPRGDVQDVANWLDPVLTRK